MLPEKQTLINYRISRALETVQEAKLALDNNFLFNAENRIYYSIFYIISALALKNGFTTSKHRQLFGWFNKEFVRTGIVSTELSEIYRDSFQNRKRGDYDDFVIFNLEDVQKHYDDMLKFIEAIRNLI